MEDTELPTPDFLKDFDIMKFKGRLWMEDRALPKNRDVKIRVKKYDNYLSMLSLGILEYQYMRLYFQEAPCGNCGVMQMSSPYFLLGTEYGKDFLKYFEAFSRSRNKSVLIGNDGVDRSVWGLIKKYGEDYTFIEAGWNRNYDKSSPHRVGLFYKNIGENSYPNIYGLGKAFDPPDYNSDVVSSRTQF